jgi:hypothetical protein
MPVISFSSQDGDEDLIAQEQERLRAVNPGMKVTKSMAIRSMMIRASAITDEPNGKPKSVTSEVFKKGKK